jgi:hypothetical protein
VRKPETVRDPLLQSLLLRAIRTIGFPGVSVEGFAAWLTAHVSAPDVGLFVGYTKDAPQGVVFVLLPSTPFMHAPQLILGFNEGPAELHRLASIRIRQWLQDNGHSGALAITRRDGRAFRRCFKDFGRPSPYASVVKFDFDD